MYSDDRFRCPGHGTLVETPDNRHFYLYHAYDADVNVYIGRQGMLDEVIWDKTTGWPSFRYGKTPSRQAESPVPTVKQEATPVFTDNFSSPVLRKEWIWDVSEPKPVVNISSNKLYIEGNNTHIGSFLGLQAKKANYTFIAELNEKNNESAGISVYGTHENGFGIAVEKENIVLWQVKQGNRRVLATKPFVSYPVSLCIITQFGQYCRFGFMEQNNFQQIGELILLNELPQWDRPSMVGVYSKGEGVSVFSNVSLIWEILKK